MAAERPLLSSEPAPEDRVTTSSTYPRSLESLLSISFYKKNPRVAAVEFPDMLVRTTPISLHRHASESPGEAQNTSEERLKAITTPKGPTKQQVEARNTYPPADMRNLSLLRLSRLPPTPKTALRLSRSSSSPKTDAPLSRISSALETRNYRPTGFPLIFEET